MAGCLQAGFTFLPYWGGRGGDWGAVYTGCHCPVTAGQKGGGGWETDIRDPPWAQANFPPPLVGH